MKRALILLPFLLLVTGGFAQTTTGKASGIKAADLKRIRATKLRFLVPTFVPKGYKVAKVELETGKDPALVYLNITYKKGSSEFAIQHASDGLGDLIFGEDPDKGTDFGVYTWSSSIFKGKQGLEYQVEKGKPQWHVQWIELSGKKYPRYLSAYGHNCKPRDGVEVMESLRYLK